MSLIRKISVSVTSVCLAMVIWTGSAQAAQVTVVKGDSLWAIANRNGTTVEDILQLNNLSSDKLQPGMVLNISDPVNQAFRPQVAPQQQASRGVVDRAEAVLEYAKQFVGIRYRSGGDSPSGFDCSGYVRYVYNNFNIDLDRTAAGQSNNGTSVKRDELQPGDLVFFNTSGSGISHSGIYVGDNQFIHSSSSKGITIDSMSDGYWSPKFRGGSRIL